MGHKRSRRRQPGGKKFKHPSLLKRINRSAAGIDCGSEAHYVAVPPERDPEPVRSFKTFTSDLHRLADWLEGCKIKTVAMESTGVYWIPIFEILEERGFEVVLVNARHITNVPGRKTDVLDCQWIQELHSVGLLRGSFRPAAEIASLRAYLRHREKLVQSAASHIQRMQKALVQMNLQLHNGTIERSIFSCCGNTWSSSIPSNSRSRPVMLRSSASYTSSRRGSVSPRRLFRLHAANFDSTTTNPVSRSAIRSTALQEPT